MAKKVKAPKAAKAKAPKVPPLPKEPKAAKPKAAKVKAPKVPPLPKPRKTKTVVLHTRVPPDLAAKVKAVAKVNKVTVSRLLHEILRKL